MRHQGDMTFAPIWKKSSSKPIFLNEDNVYFGEDRVCYSLCGRNIKKYKLFRFENENISNFGHSRAKASTFYSIPSSPSPNSSCFLTLRNNALLRHSSRTGQLLDKIFLGHAFSFSSMSVDVQQNTLILQSVCFNKFRTRNTNTIQAIIIISLNPFQFMCHLELTAAVAGQGVKDVRIADGMLLLAVGNCTRVYSVAAVLSMGKKLCSCDFDEDCSLQHGPVGRFPQGVPVNLQLQGMSPVVFEVMRSHSLSFGGFPLHCLHSPTNERKRFCLMQVSDQSTTELDVDVRTIYDECAFHPTRPNILIHQSNHSLSFHKLTNGPEKSTLTEVFCIKTDGLQNPDKMERKRSSDRPERSTAFRGAFIVHARTLFETQYDHSLDLHLVRATSSHEIMKSSLFMYSPSGELIREVKIGQSLHKGATCSFALSLDKLLVAEQTDGLYNLTVYQLKRKKQAPSCSLISL